MLFTAMSDPVEPGTARSRRRTRIRTSPAPEVPGYKPNRAASGNIFRTATHARSPHRETQLAPKSPSR